MSIKQFVPSDVCLKCEGCCRFNMAQSPWRPKVGEAEALAKQTDDKGYLTTKPLGNRHQCQFFNAKDYTCGVYSQRPFECVLYPFVLSLEDSHIHVYVHLACPYVQEFMHEERFHQYVAYLKDWFSSLSVGYWLQENPRLLHDYRHAQVELQWVLTLKKDG